VYEFAKARLGRRVWAVKGESAKNGQRNPVWPTKRPSSKTKQAFRPIILGVNAAKDVIRSNLLKTEAGAGYMHFPADRDTNYFEQFNAERIVVKTVGGRKYRVWEQIPGRANEALDARVYAYAALCGLKHFGLHLNARVEAMEQVFKPSAEPPANPAPKAPQAAFPQRQNFFGRERSWLR
jgi:phage terminase large subunit GpA-like protein